MVITGRTRNALALRGTRVRIPPTPLLQVSQISDTLLLYAKGDNMTKKDILELKRRFTKNECTFTKMCGCYVNAHKEIVVTFDETFLNLPDEEFYKYLEIAKKTLSGTLGNNLLELEFPLSEEGAGGRQQFLMGLRSSELKNEDLLMTFYQQIIDSYDYVGNFLILLFHDVYDVVTKTTDNSKLDESEEVFDYMICAICPVALSKPGLGYREEENRIGARIQDWVVGVPENGFLFPAFSDRSSDIHSLLYYTRNAKEPHPELMENGLGCGSKQTATEKKETFRAIVHKAVGDDTEKGDEIFMEIQEGLNNLLETQEEIYGKTATPMLLKKENMEELMSNIEVPQEVTAKIKQSFEENFGDEAPEAEFLLDSKALVANTEKKEKQVLENQVVELKQQLEEKTAQCDAALVAANTMPETRDEETMSVKTYDVILRVKPQKVDQIKSQMIDGKKCIVIPMEDDEHANVNGVNTIV